MNAANDGNDTSRKLDERDKSLEDLPDDAVAPVNEKVSLPQLAPGLKLQYDCFQDALMEVIDNGVSSAVEDESYFEDPNESIEINITMIRRGDRVWFVVADNGTGIEQETASETLFRLSDTSSSSGILNNVGWGLKQSLSWFESKVHDDGVSKEDGFSFTVLTSTESADDKYAIDGPITSSKYLRKATDDEWEIGIDGVSQLSGVEYGTRVHIPCSWEQVNDDLWGGEDTSLSTRAQALREDLGMRFRRLLNAHEDNRIVLTVKDETEGEMSSFEVHPIELHFAEYTGDERPVTFEVTGDGVDYRVEYERGKLDFDAMAKNAEEKDDRLVTSSRNFRSRYKEKKKHQGVDVYANGRVMNTSVISELYRRQDDPDKYLSRDDTLNAFGGEIRIVPKDPSEQVPTDNTKISVDTSSEVWENIEDKVLELGGVTRTWDSSSDEESSTSENTDEDPDAERKDETTSAKSNTGDDTDGSSTTTTGPDLKSSQQGEKDTEKEDESKDTTDTNSAPDSREREESENNHDKPPRDVTDLSPEEFRERLNHDKLDHDDIAIRLADKLENEELTERVSTTDAFGGTPTDVVQYLEDGGVIIWEVKPAQAKSRDVFQTMMYQDHFKREDHGYEFRKAIILSDGSSRYAEKDLRNAENRSDEKGELYNIDQRDISTKLP